MTAPGRPWREGWGQWGGSLKERKVKGGRKKVGHRKKQITRITEGAKTGQMKLKGSGKRGRPMGCRGLDKLKQH